MHLPLIHDNKQELTDLVWSLCCKTFAHTSATLETQHVDDKHWCTGGAPGRLLQWNLRCDDGGDYIMVEQADGAQRRPVDLPARGHVVRMGRSAQEVTVDRTVTLLIQDWLNSLAGIQLTFIKKKNFYSQTHFLGKSLRFSWDLWCNFLEFY